MTTQTQQMTGRRETRDGTPVLVLERTFRAGLDDVWAAVADPERMKRWIGTWDGDPAEGHIEFRMTAEGDDIAAETYDIDRCEPPHGFAVRSREGQPFSEDGSGDLIHWVMAVDLAETPEGTRLTFTQQVEHVDVAASVGPGWEHYLGRLEAALSGGDPDDVEWSAYEGGSAYYRELFA